MLMVLAMVAGASADTFMGDDTGIGPVTVTLTVEDGKITAAEVTGEGETKGFGYEPIYEGTYAAAIVAAQGADIDVISNVTVTSNAVIAATKEAMVAAGLLAAEIGADVTIAKRAGLLHDIGKSVDFEMEGSHIQIGVDIAKKYKESETVVHAIAAHHGDVETVSIYDAIVQAADAISAARPGARRENLENYIKRLEKLEEIANSFPGVEKTFAIQAGREIRIMVDPEKISDDKMTILSHDIAKKIEGELEYPGQIKVHLIRESRSIDFAK
jgi:ribonuclease Y